MADTATAQERHLSLRMPAVVIDELKAVAEENGRTLSQEARLALKAWLVAASLPDPADIPLTPRAGRTQSNDAGSAQDLSRARALPAKGA